MSLSGARAADSSTAALDDSEGLKEIIVTARKVAENLQEVPISITAFSGEELQARNAVTFYDIQQGTPNFFARGSSQSPNTLTMAIRGQVQQSPTILTDTSVGVYVDGVYWARLFGINGNLLDIHDVQVLKGPQGTLFGRNTTGGALILESNDPILGETSAVVSGRYGRFNERSGTAVLNLPLNADSLAVRFAVERDLRDGWVNDLNTGASYRDIDGLTARGKLLFKADNITAVLSGEYFYSNTAGTASQLAYIAPAGLTPPAPTPQLIAAGAAAAAALNAAGLPVPGGVNPFRYGSIGSLAAAQVAVQGGPSGFASARGLTSTLASHPDSAALDTPPLNRTSTRNLTLTVTDQTDFADFKLITGYRDVSDRSINDSDGSSYRILAIDADVSQKQYSAELQVTGSAFNKALDFAFGAYYFQERGYSFQTSSSITNISPTVSPTVATTDNDNIGPYGQITWHMMDRLSLTGGLRYSIDDKRSTTRNHTRSLVTNAVSCVAGGPVVTSIDTCALHQSDRFSGISYLASAQYDLTDHAMVYASVAHSFRSGGQNNLATQPAFDPEKATSYEIGEKSGFFKNKLQFNLAGYYTLTDDIQRISFTALPDGTTVGITRNAGKAQVWGLEAELKAELPLGFGAALTAAVTEPTYLEYAEVPRQADLNGDRRTEPFDSVPTRQASASLSYKHGFGNVELNMRADYSWTREFQLMPPQAFLGDPLGVTVDPNTGKTIIKSMQAATMADESNVLNGRAALTFGGGLYEVALWGRNLTDDRGVVAALSVATLNFASVQRREPRTYGVEFTVRLGEGR